MLSHLSVAPHALAASNEAGDRHIDAFMNISPSDQGSPPPAVKSQHERCQDMWETTQTDLIDTLDVRREDQEGGWERSSACQEADFEGFERTSSWDGTTERIDK